jgi:hypothetical protein
MAGDPLSNGRLEGANNKLGLVKRMGAYGFVNADQSRARPTTRPGTLGPSSHRGS